MENIKMCSIPITTHESTYQAVSIHDECISRTVRRLRKRVEIVQIRVVRDVPLSHPPLGTDLVQELVQLLLDFIVVHAVNDEDVEEVVG